MAEIALHGKAGKGLMAHVDDEDLDRVLQHRWYALRARGSYTIYARTTINGRTVYLHRMVMRAESQREIDHIDGDGLNNRKANLRHVTHGENMRAARRMFGRFGAPTEQELDRELIEFEARFGTSTEQKVEKTL